MVIKQKICAGWDGKTHPAFIWKRILGKPYCKVCTMRIQGVKPIVSKKPIVKVSEKQKEKNQNKKENTALLHSIMYKWWKTFGDFKTCESCGVEIQNKFSVINVHHLLPKAKYKDVALDPRYFMLLCGDCHTSFEIAPNRIKHKEIFIRTEIAKNQYNARRK